MKTHLRKLWTTALALGATFTLAAAATVTASLEAPEVALGDSVQLTVTVSGAEGQPTLPDIDGLQIASVGQSSQFQFSNGVISASASSTYVITPQHEGTYTIPAIRVGNAESKPLTLRVTKGAPNVTAAPYQQQQRAPRFGQGPVVQPSNPPQLQQQDDDSATAPGRFGSLQIVIPKTEFYDGELVPVDVKAIIPGDLNSSPELPQFTSDGFTLNSLGNKPQQTVQVVGGKTCVILTWHSTLTAVKTGEYPVSMQMPETVIVRQQRRATSDDDMFGNFFDAFGMASKKNVTLQTEPISLKVLPLPQADRPTDFAGAVGQFEVETSATPTKVNAGDPVTLRLKISGQGNFDRVASDMLIGDAHWKTYSPKSHFDTGDSVGFEGAKIFEQPVIPGDSSVTSVPSLSFSYFDPEKKQYVTRTTAPIAVAVSGAAVASATPPSSTAPSSATPAPSPAATPSDLRANKIESGSFVATLTPIYRNPIFLAAQIIPLLALFAGFALVRRREITSQPQHARATAMQQAIREHVHAMDEAMKAGNTGAFFVHARTALQQRLGQKWNLRPETITLAEVDRHLGQGSENIRPIFEMADQASYSDLHFEESDLRQWRDVILHELTETK